VIDQLGLRLQAVRALDEQQQCVEHFVTERHALVIAPKLTLLGVEPEAIEHVYSSHHRRP
jgi:hypothetical protein